MNITQTFSNLAQGSNTVTLFRFTPKQEYAFTVSGPTGMTKPTKPHYLTAGATGVDEYDSGKPLVTISGAPTYEIMVVDRGGGLVGFDTYGWVVLYVKTANGAWDQFPAELGDYDLVTLGAGEVTSSSGFNELSNLDQNVKSASGDDFSSLSHEASVDYDVEGLPVLSLQTESKYFSGLSEEQQGNKLVRWDRGNDTLEVLYDLFDFYNPVTDYGACSGRNPEDDPCRPSRRANATAGDRKLSGPWPGRAQDWSHANSAARGTQNNWIMSARHLSSVISFHDDGSGIQWVLSGEGVKPSKDPKALVFDYDSEASHQYNEHCARQLKNGNVPVKVLQNTFFRSNALRCTATACLLIPAECSAAVS